MQIAETREDAPELLGDDSGISQPPPCAVTPVDLLHLEGGVCLGARASRRVSECLYWRVMKVRVGYLAKLSYKLIENI